MPKRNLPKSPEVLRAFSITMALASLMQAFAVVALRCGEAALETQRGLRPSSLKTADLAGDGVYSL